MVSFKKANVKEVKEVRKGLVKVIIEFGSGEKGQAVNYSELTGPVKVGDEVIVNTVAVDLELGTGDVHFILWNLSLSSFNEESKGHIMKLRYTPLQFSCSSAEEQLSSYHEALREAQSLNKTPVVIGSLHSQLPAVAATAKELNGELKVVYVMTDGGALPLVFSDLVEKLLELKLVDETVTCGHAFGGGIETINVFSGLVAAKVVAKADIVIVIMGPGIVGTDTLLGFSGIEQGEIINAVTSLGGLPVAIPRLSFKDKRIRHFGISHHTLTSLSLAALARCVVTLPQMAEDKKELVRQKMLKAGIYKKHKVEVVENNVTLEALRKRNLRVTTMGRSIDEEPEFFKAAGAAAIYAVEVLKGKREVDV